MSEQYQFPVMLWKSHSGIVSGRLLDGDSRGCAVGDSQQAVIRQLTDFIHYLGKNDWLWEVEPDLYDVELRQVKVSVFPEYRVRARTFPSKDPVPLRLPAAIGRRENGLYAAVLPTVDVVFDFDDPDSFNDLAQHYVRNTLAGLSPRDVAPYLPPKKSWLEELRIRVKPPEENRGDHQQETPLRNVADHLGDRELRRLSKTWERNREVRDLVARLSDTTASLCLVGASGCGKTSVLIEAARRVERAKKEKGRHSAHTPKIFWLSSAARLIAGMRYLGQWEERLEQVIDETASLEGVLCVENLLELVRLGGSAAQTSVGAFLVPYLEHGELRLVTEATPDEIEACARLLPGLVDQLQVFKLESFDDRQSRRILQNAATALSNTGRPRPTPDAAATTFHLFRRFLPYEGFPGRAISFLDETVDAAQRAGKDAVDPAFTRAHFGTTTGLPQEFLDDDKPFILEETATHFDGKVIGQPEAVRAVCGSLARFKAGLNDPARPLGVFLFSGPTGVGKTALVRALGDYLFTNKPPKERIIRLDMSEYGSFDASRRLLGDPYGEPSELVRRIRANPFTVLLLDEIEKASEEVFDIFLNVFEEGRLTDTFGRLTAFNSTLIIMTSNLGAPLTSSLGFQQGDAIDEAAVDESTVRKFFRPEFFNRIDHVVPFHPLTRGTVLDITRIELRAIAGREGLVTRRIRLTFSDDLITKLAEAGFNPKLGARPLQRKIEENITIPLARHLISNPHLRDTTVHLGWENGSSVLSEKN